MPCARPSIRARSARGRGAGERDERASRDPRPHARARDAERTEARRAGARPRARAERDAGAGGGIGLRQDAHGAGRARDPAARGARRGGRDPVARARPARPRTARAARPLRQGARALLPRARQRLRSRAHAGRADRRAAAPARTHVARRGLAARRAAPRGGRAPGSGGSRAALSPRALGRPAPARDAGHGARLRPFAPDRRRADERARRPAAARGPGAPRAAARASRDGAALDHARPRRGGGAGRARGRDAGWAHRRAGRRARGVRAPLPRDDEGAPARAHARARARPASGGGAVSAPLLEVAGLSVEYRLRGALGLGTRGRVRALEDVAFTLAHGETLALVGRSGSGKSSVARALLGLMRPSAGRVLYRREPGAQGVDLLALSGRARRAGRRELGIVFQDPFASLNPRLPVGEAVAEPVRVHGSRTAREARTRAGELFERVGLGSDALARFPHEFSGGQRQRIAIARALALGPRFVVLDEAVSALDAAMRAQILGLLAELRRELGLAYLFITHDLALARALAGRVVVLADGRAVESGPVEEVLGRPRHAATRELVDAILSGDPRARRLGARLGGAQDPGAGGSRMAP